MAKFNWSETFLSIEGEAMFSGHPTVYVRFTKCNFECKGFNNPDNVDPADPRVLGFYPEDLKSVNEIPEITVGCDSIYSWHKDFQHMWKEGDETELAAELTDLLPNKRWKNGDMTTILSLTGGEPTLRAKTIPALLNKLTDVKNVIIETNASVPLKSSFIEELSKWCKEHNSIITWSNSPKLSVSGEPREKAIVPSVVLMQREMEEDFIQYFKFVCSDSDADFNEVAEVMEIYYEAGIPRDVPVYIMPVSCTEDQQREIMMAVADKCIQRGYIYCHRIHNTVYENAIGK